MRVLLAGCGYVGAELGRELARQGHQVFGLRRSSDQQAELQAADIVPLRGDATTPQDLAQLPGPFDWVVNTLSAGRGGIEAYQRTYLEGTRCLLEWLRQAPPQGYVYTSSTAVYGQNDGSLVDESSAVEPASETGKILAATETMVLEANAKCFPAVVLRVAGIYGPGRGYWLHQFLAGQAVLEGAGERWLNMVHRDDVVGAILAVLRQKPSGGICNVVDDEPVTQRDLFEWLSQTLGQPMPPSASVQEPTLRMRAVTNKRISNSKLKKELGYTFKYPTFREGYRAEIARLRAG